jgi:hypothetical protein
MLPTIRSLIVLWCVTAVVGCASATGGRPSSIGEPLLTITGDGFSGAIVPRFVHFPESWEPEQGLVAAAEPKVQQCVVARHPALRSVLNRYFRHYGGTTRDGERVLRVQFFDTNHYRANDLKHALEVVDGAGDDYFVVVYNLQTGQCSF